MHGFFKQETSFMRTPLLFRLPRPPARAWVVPALAVLLLLGWSAPADAQIRGRQSNTKIGLNRINLSGVTYTLTDSAGATEATNSDALEGNEVFLEFVFFGRIGLEFGVGLTEMVRNYELETGGTTISNVEEVARPATVGLNLYFRDHASPGFKFFFGLATGLVSVSHTFRGGTLGEQSSSQSVPINILKIGMDWIKDKAGFRAQVFSQTGELTDTEAIADFTQNLNYTATGLSIGVFAFF